MDICGHGPLQSPHIVRVSTVVLAFCACAGLKAAAPRSGVEAAPGPATSKFIGALESASRRQRSSHSTTPWEVRRRLPVSPATLTCPLRMPSHDIKRHRSHPNNRTCGQASVILSLSSHAHPSLRFFDGAGGADGHAALIQIGRR